MLQPLCYKQTNKQLTVEITAALLQPLCYSHSVTDALLRPLTFVTFVTIVVFVTLTFGQTIPDFFCPTNF